MRRILFYIRNDGTDTRFRKTLKSLLRAGASVDVVVIGGGKKLKTNIGDTYTGSLRVQSIPAFKNIKIAKLRNICIWATLVVKVSAKLVRGSYTSMHAVDEEAFLVCFLAKLLGIRVVLDLYDSFELSSRSRTGSIVLKKVPLLFLSRVCHVFADRIIVTDILRQGLLRAQAKKSLVVPNYPSSNDLPALDTLTREKEQSSSITLFVGGSLSAQRGISTLRKLMEIRSNIKIICAGWLYDDVAREFVKSERVQYFGIVSANRAHEISARCDYTFAFYEPGNFNNVYASPNKIYDALCIGQKVLLNSETKISEFMTRAKLVASSPYNDHVSLSKKISKCSWDSRRFARGYRKIFVWEAHQEKLLCAHELSGK